MRAFDILKYPIDRLRVALGILDMEEFVPAVALLVDPILIDEVFHVRGAI